MQRTPTNQTRSATGECSDPPIIEVQGLVKSYGTDRVVDDVDFDVAPGEIFGLLGANGAGKTTTVECLQGLRRPDAGRLRVLGHDPNTDRRHLRNLIGSQLQDSALPDQIRVAEAVRLFDRNGGRDVDAHLGRWGLGDKADTSFINLSGGQRQRLFIVLALLNEPEVVFLDELTQGLDPAARRDVWDVIRSIRDDGATVVLVSHFADEVEALCDRVAVMSHGRIVDVGTPREITDRHAHATTISCTVPAILDCENIAALPGVESVHVDGDQLTVAGASPMIAPVCAATLDRAGLGPHDLRVTHPSLNDALLALIGPRP